MLLWTIAINYRLHLMILDFRFNQSKLKGFIVLQPKDIRLELFSQTYNYYLNLRQKEKK